MWYFPQIPIVAIWFAVWNTVLLLARAPTVYASLAPIDYCSFTSDETACAGKSIYTVADTMDKDGARALGPGEIARLAFGTLDSANCLGQSF